MLNEKRMTVEEGVVKINANTKFEQRNFKKHAKPARQGNKSKVNKFKALYLIKKSQLTLAFKTVFFFKHLTVGTTSNH